MRNTELLVPASSLEVLKVAVIYGADAVYIGGEVYGLRAKAKNFSKEDMIEGIKFAHDHGITYADLKRANLWLRESKLNNKSHRTYYIDIPSK